MSPALVGRFFTTSANWEDQVHIMLFMTGMEKEATDKVKLKT